MNTFYKINLTLLLLICSVVVFGQKTDKNKFLVISLTIKGITLYDGIELKRDLFDSTTCLSLSFDTISSKDSIKHFKNKLIFDLDTIKETYCFSIIKFVTTCGYVTFDSNGHAIATSDIEFPHDGGCLVERDINIAKNMFDYARVFFDDIYINYNNGTAKYNFPNVYYKLKN